VAQQALPYTSEAPDRTSSSLDRRMAHPNHRWFVLAVLALAQLMVVLDATVVTIALPSAQKALHFSTADRQWVVTAYSLAFGSLLLLGGRLSDLLGRKRMFVFGLIGFASASALGGASTGFFMLASARALQGAFGAMLAPAALSLVTTTFSDPKDRGKAFGIYGAVAGAGGAVGLLLGGALTQYLDWRWSLYINDVLGVVAVAAALMLLPPSAPESGVKMDWPGVITVVSGLVGIVYGLSEADTAGWSSPLTLAFLAVGAALLGVFVVVEGRAQHPLLPLRVILDRNRGAADLAFLVSGIGTFGVFLFLTYYVQLTLHFAPFKAGLAFLPMVAVLVVTSAYTNTVISMRVGPRWIVTSGMAVSAAGLVIFAQLDVHSTYLGGVVPGLLVTGVGLGLVFGTSLNAATARAAARDAGVASALVNVGQQVGGSIGTALLNTLAASAVSSYVASHGASSMAVAVTKGEDLAFWVGAGIFAVGAVVSALLFQSGRIRELPSNEGFVVGV